ASASASAPGAASPSGLPVRTPTRATNVALVVVGPATFTSGTAEVTEAGAPGRATGAPAGAESGLEGLADPSTLVLPEGATLTPEDPAQLLGNDLLAGPGIAGSLLFGTKPVTTLARQRDASLAPVATVLTGETGEERAALRPAAADEDLPFLHRTAVLNYGSLRGLFHGGAAPRPPRPAAPADGSAEARDVPTDRLLAALYRAVAEADDDAASSPPWSGAIQSLLALVRFPPGVGSDGEPAGAVDGEAMPPAGPPASRVREDDWANLRRLIYPLLSILFAAAVCRAPRRREDGPPGPVPSR